MKRARPTQHGSNHREKGFGVVMVLNVLPLERALSCFFSCFWLIPSLLFSSFYPWHLSTFPGGHTSCEPRPMCFICLFLSVLSCSGCVFVSLFVCLFVSLFVCLLFCVVCLFGSVAAVAKVGWCA